jgi:hypothetical protein
MLNVNSDLSIGAQMNTKLLWPIPQWFEKVRVAPKASLTR